MTTGGRALVLAGVWLSPAVLLSVGPLLLADATRGLWTPLALGGGALVAVALLAVPWSRHAGSHALTLVGLAQRRWPSAEGALAPLAVADVASGLLFVWAQFGAGGEIAHALGWAPGVLIGGAVAVLAPALWHDGLGARVGGLAGAIALVGLALPLAGVAAVTTPWWPRVWAEVAWRPRVVFGDGSPWTTEGRPIRGPGAEAVVAFEDEQHVVLRGRGRVRIEPRDGGSAWREVGADTDLALRSGDRLVVPDGFPVRFQPGRRIPGAPATGSDWVEPSGRRADWRALVGVGVTFVFGALGLAPVHAALPGGGAGHTRAARAGAITAVVGMLLAVVWALYAAWLVPEIYIAGVAGTEVYELPASVPTLGRWAGPLAALAVAGLAMGGVASALSALRAVARALPFAAERGSMAAAGVLASAALLAALTPARPGTLLLLAFGLGAAVGAPAAVFGCWVERLTARGVAAGATVGLVLFVGLSIGGLASVDRAGLGPPGPGLGWLLAWPALVALPANTLATWLFSSRPTPSARSPLPPGLSQLYE